LGRNVRNPSAIFLVAILAYAIIQNKKLAKESCFFKDIVDIIDVMENSEEWKRKKGQHNEE
jgi:hypothetical protein